jgi:hypothetical protein
MSNNTKLWSFDRNTLLLTRAYEGQLLVEIAEYILSNTDKTVVLFCPGELRRRRFIGQLKDLFPKASLRNVNNDRIVVADCNSDTTSRVYVHPMTSTHYRGVGGDILIAMDIHNSDEKKSLLHEVLIPCMAMDLCHILVIGPTRPGKQTERAYFDEFTTPYFASLYKHLFGGTAEIDIE